MTREEHNHLEQDFKHASKVLVLCFLFALVVVCCFLFFFAPKSLAI